MAGELGTYVESGRELPVDNVGSKTPGRVYAASCSGNLAEKGHVRWQGCTNPQEHTHIS